MDYYADTTSPLVQEWRDSCIDYRQAEQRVDKIKLELYRVSMTLPIDDDAVTQLQTALDVARRHRTQVEDETHRRFMAAVKDGGIRLQ